MNCRVCKRPLTNPTAIANGVGPICATRGQNDGEGTKAGLKVKLLNHNSDGSRSWLVFSEPRVLVRVTPIDEEISEYRCGFGQCQNCLHIDAVKAAEAELTARYAARMMAAA